MDLMGVERITRVLITSDKAGNISKISVKKMKISASPENLAITSVKFAAVEYAGRPFCDALYLEDGDDPIIFGVYIILKDLDCYVVAGSTFCEYIRTRQQYSKAALLIKSLREHLLE